MTLTVQSMLTNALARVPTLTAQQAMALHGQAGVVFVDLRDSAELQQEGAVPGALHAPRGMLEFWVDPASPWHRADLHQPDTHYLLFCAGGLRSALAAQLMLDMGVQHVSHLGGGLTAWKAAGGPVDGLKGIN